jgi:hypothetical protein
MWNRRRPERALLYSLLFEFIIKKFFGTDIDWPVVKKPLFLQVRAPLMSPEKKILVPLMPSAKGLKGVHYAMSLAERLCAHVYILQQVAGTASNTLSIWMDEALLDLINSARKAGLVVSHHIIRGQLEEEIVGLVRSEGIDFLVFGDDDGSGEHLVLQIKPLIASQIIQVKGKDHISYLKQEDGTR